MLSLEWGGEVLEVHAERAVYWPGRRTLILADPHFGKAASFRSLGIPVPAGTTAADLARVDTLLNRAGAQRLMILGDFFHARAGRVAREVSDLLSGWRERRRELEIVLVRGNHDVRAGDPCESWGITCHTGVFTDGPFAFSHAPVDDSSLPLLAGHVHPVAVLEGAGGAWIRPPCLLLRPHLAVFPAFGSFTGGHPVRPSAGDRVFVFGGDEAVEVRLRM